MKLSLRIPGSNQTIETGFWGGLFMASLLTSKHLKKITIKQGAGKMERIEYRNVTDKSSWPRGPWDDEPDKVQWPDEATGMPCVAVRGPVGSWCGYVGVAKGHPLHGVDYDACPIKCGKDWCEHSPSMVLDVHGGVTFAGECRHGDVTRSICHIPAPGESDDVWWIGFDMAHAGDVMPAHINLLPSYGRFPDEQYRDLAYVTQQCAVLAQQLQDKGK